METNKEELHQKCKFQQVGPTKACKVMVRRHRPFLFKRIITTSLTLISESHNVLDFHSSISTFRNDWIKIEVAVD